MTNKLTGRGNLDKETHLGKMTRRYRKGEDDTTTQERERRHEDTGRGETTRRRHRKGKGDTMTQEGERRLSISQGEGFYKNQTWQHVELLDFRTVGKYISVA